MTLPSPAPLINDFEDARQAFEILWRVVRESTGAGWIAVSFAGGWDDYGSSYSEAGYYKDGLGIVHLKGTLNPGTGTIFTLPAGYRPAELLAFPSAGDGAMCQVDVQPDGDVVLAVGSPTTSLTLDGITFRAA